MQSRAKGCFLGQVAGDSLGSLVEFMNPDRIAREYPNGIKYLWTGGIWGTLAGQPTDDSEMAIALARSIVKQGFYDEKDAVLAYRSWYKSIPFDMGYTIASALQGKLNYDSQANGAMMRSSPIGIFGANKNPDEVYELGVKDAALTHPNPICLQTNGLYVSLIADTIKTGDKAEKLFARMQERAKRFGVEESVLKVIKKSEEARPRQYCINAGWVLTAFQNALWHFLHSETLESAVRDTVMQGGDSDTNAAICGALLGALYGEEAIPEQWRTAVLSCKPEKGCPGVERPRPQEYWPTDILELAEKLLSLP